MEMPMFAMHYNPVVRRNVEVLEAAAAVLVLLAFVSLAVGAAALDVARLLGNVFAVVSG